MSTSKAIKRAVRYALLTGATMAVALPVNAADDEIIQEVIVTGSLIPMNLEAPGVPVTIMTSSDIAASGVTGDMLDVLTKTVPFFYGGLNIGSDNGNISSGSTNGGSMVSLRNRSTLVLINGRRAAVSPVAASGGFTFTDVSLIPVSAVERVEILADGASATYGADAVGGVVNIIMKDNFDGVQVGGRYGFDDGGDYNERSAYFTAGTSTADTSVTFSAEWKKSDPLIQADRSWGRGIYRTNSFAGSIFDLESDADEVFYFLDPSMNAPDGSLNIPITQAAAAGYSGPLATNAQYFDLADKPTMLLGSERKSAMLVWDHSISNYFGLFGDVLVSNTKSWSQLNAQPVGGVVAADHPFNPFDQDVYVTNRFQAFPRQYETDTTGWRGVVGARGDIVGSWKYEVAANYNRAESTHRNPGLIDANAYFAAVDLAYSDDPEEVAMAYNPFARVQAPGVLESFQGEAWEGYVSRLTSYDAKVYGDLFSLPAGVVRLAVGASTAKESLSFVNDRFSREGLWLQATPSSPFDASMDRQGYYTEARIPIFSPDFNVAGFYALDLSLAGRYETFSTTSSEFVPKFTLRWQPLGETFAVRATYSESFTAPTLFELFGPIGQGFTSNQQLLRYNADGTPRDANADGVQDVDTATQYRAQSGSNVDLDPSSSKNWSIGFDWRPEGALSGLQVNLDYWSIKEEDIVDELDEAIILQSVEALGPNSPYADLVRRGVSAAGELYFGTGAPISAPGEISSAVGDTVWLTNSLINLSGIDQDGLDLKVAYSFDTDSMGTFSAQLISTFLFSYDLKPAPTEPVIKLKGVYHDSYGLFPDYRVFAQLGWAYQNWTAGLNATYLPTLDDVTFGEPFGRVDSYMTWDLRVGYGFSAFGQNLGVSAGVNNRSTRSPCSSSPRVTRAATLRTTIRSAGSSTWS